MSLIRHSWFLACTLFLASPLLAGGAFEAAKDASGKPCPEVTTPDGYKAPTRITWGRDKSEMVLIPGGTYTIGRDVPVGSDSAESAEGPPHDVELGSFYIDAHEITLRQYQEFSKATGANLPRTTNAKLLDDPDKPVIGITYEDARAYAKWAQRDLPTEAEWEAAARGHEKYVYPWGNDFDASKVVSNRGATGSTEKVGTTPGDTSPMGVSDMAGNVSEWVKDWFSHDYHKLASGKNPPGPADGISRSVRGGSFYSRGEAVRVTQRSGQIAGQLRDELGFRTVFRLEPPRTATPTPAPTPTPETEINQAEVAKDMIDKLAPALKSGSAIPPSDGDRVAPSDTGKPVLVLNFTPQAVSLVFLDPKERTIYGYGRAIAPGKSESFPLPIELDLYMYAYCARSKAVTEPILMGVVRADSDPLVVIPAHTFSQVRLRDGTTLGPTPGMEAQQFYGEFSFDFSELEVYNDTPELIQVAIGPDGDGRLVTEKADKRQIKPGEAARFRFAPIPLILESTYAGGKPADVARKSFKADASADHRLFLIRQDANSSERVSVLARKLPPLKIDAENIIVNHARKKLNIRK